MAPRVRRRPRARSAGLIDAAVLVVGIALTMGLRLLPYRMLGVMGVDAWFHVLYARAIRAQRRLPARLTSFLLERPEQRYPPLLALLLALVPGALARRAQPWIAPLFDAVHLTLLVVTARTLGWDTGSTVVAALVFATTPTLVLEHSTLSPRSLACGLFSAFMLAVLKLLLGGGVPWLIGAGLLGALVLLANKMATQLLILTALALTIVTGRLDVAAAGALAAALAWLLSAGFYSEVLRGHVAILRFWRHRTTHVNAHQVYDSPLYSARRPATAVPTRLYRRGAAGAGRLAKGLAGNAPWLLVVPVAWFVGPRDPIHGFLVLWCAVGVAAAVGTAFAPSLRFLGQGARYLKFATFPAALLLGRGLGGWPACLVAAALVAVDLMVIARLLRARPFEELSDPFRDVLEFLRHDPRSRVATVPSHYSPAIACLAGKQVLWGGHSSGYDELAVWSPVLQQPVEAILDAYDVPLLLVDTRYVDPAHLLGERSRYRLLRERGTLQLFERVA